MRLRQLQTGLQIRQRGGATTAGAPAAEAQMQR